MNRIIAIPDIHGEFGLLKTLVEESICFDPLTDTLVFLGDYQDRGDGNKEVIEYLTALRSKYGERIILLKGNHEQMAFDYLTGKSTWSLWGGNGGDATFASYDRNLKLCKEVLIPFIESLKLYHETDTHVFTHGGITGNREPKSCTEDTLLWTRNVRLYTGKKILVVGHTIVDDVTVLPNSVIMVDTGAYRSGKLSAIDINTNQVYQAVKKQVVQYSVQRDAKPVIESVADFSENKELESDEEEELEEDRYTGTYLDKEFEAIMRAYNKGGNDDRELR
jgi:serine/threonine protein phosphatase 1